MRTRRLVFAIAASAALVTACGSSNKSSSDTTGAPATTAAAATTAAPATTASGGAATSAASGAAPITVAQSSLGQILTDANGMTVYGFTNDSAGTSTCTGGCAKSWPAVTTTSDELPAGLDAKVFSVVEGADETYQLKAGKWPLYTFAGDKAAGDTNGQGSGGVWFVVAPDGSLIKG
jgi:predicted lipoprotein with Yx(FWY)xxD motif